MPLEGLQSAATAFKIFSNPMARVELSSLRKPHNIHTQIYTTEGNL